MPFATPAKAFLKKTPLIGPILLFFYAKIATFESRRYWEVRYREGDNSGNGSYGVLAEFKAEVLNQFVEQHQVRSVIEFGCGDGNQLSLMHYPSYTGLDPASHAVKRCRERFAADPTKQFFQLLPGVTPGEHRAELALSLDVIYHLVEDSVFSAHLESVFAAATRYVVIYSDNEDRPSNAPHVRHRRFSTWIEANRPEWKLIRHIPNRYPYREGDRNTSWADFWIYERARQ